ncbi:galactose oxidase [Boletus edulis]|nr:galactose oxidase [Boletus edulis]
MSIRWSLVNALPARSSHSVAVSNTGRLLLYSGEHRPRIPVDNDLHVLDLESTSPSLRTFAALAASRAPEPRVGASAVHDPHTNNLYVWGGRGGVDMAPLDRFQAGVWKASLDALDTPSTTTLAWERLPAVNDDSDAAPAVRSYHASALVRGKLYIHAGCPASGRLATLHAYDLATHTWYRLADAPAQPRGGTAIAAVTLTPDSELVLIRFGGFAGFQLPQVTQGTPPPLDIYTPSTDTWSTVYPAPDPEHGFPGARSVHGLVPFVTRSNVTPERIPVALLHHGERDASSVGHAGAGVFWDDAWLLVVTSTSTSTPSLEWKKLRVEGTALPEPRGWFPSASYVRDGKTRVVLTGGLLSSNERSGEVWVGDVEL